MLQDKIQITEQRNCIYRSVIYFWLDDQGFMVRFPIQARGFFLLENAQTGSGDPPPPASYSVGTEDAVLGDKAAGE
jgi:hypothetical protein